MRQQKLLYEMQSHEFSTLSRSPSTIEPSDVEDTENDKWQDLLLIQPQYSKYKRCKPTQSHLQVRKPPRRVFQQSEKTRVVPPKKLQHRHQEKLDERVQMWLHRETTQQARQAPTVDGEDVRTKTAREHNWHREQRQQLLMLKDVEEQHPCWNDDYSSRSQSRNNARDRMIVLVRTSLADPPRHKRSYNRRPKQIKSKPPPRSAPSKPGPSRRKS